MSGFEHTIYPQKGYPRRSFLLLWMIKVHQHSIQCVHNWKLYFLSVSSLETVDFIPSLTSVWEGASYHCFNLASTIISSSVSSVGSNAFRNCSNLASVIHTLDQMILRELAWLIFSVNKSIENGLRVNKLQFRFILWTLSKSIVQTWIMWIILS